MLTLISSFYFPAVPEEALARQRGEAEGGHSGERRAVLCVRVHAGKPVPADQGPRDALPGVDDKTDPAADPDGAGVHAPARLLPPGPEAGKCAVLRAGAGQNCRLWAGAGDPVAATLHGLRVHAVVRNGDVDFCN